MKIKLIFSYLAVMSFCLKGLPAQTNRQSLVEKGNNGPIKKLSPIVKLPDTKLINHSNEAIYKAVFQAPDDMDLKSQIKIYYKGAQLPIKNGTFLLTEDANANIFNIIFTEGACPEFEESYSPTARIANIKTIEGCRARYFHLSRKNPLSDDEDSQWKVQEININKKPFKIPQDRTIIILMNPAHLPEETKDVFKNSNASSSKTVVSLPNIILSRLLDKQEEQRSTLLAQMSAIDLNTIHARECDQICEQRESKVIIHSKS